MADPSDNIGIIVTSYERHLPFLGQCFESLIGISYSIILGWDGEIDMSLKTRSIPKNVKCICSTGENRLGYHKGEKAQILAGTKWLETKYILKISGDQEIKRPENIEKLSDFLGDDDMVFHKGDLTVGTGRIETKTFFAKREPVIRLLKAHEFSDKTLKTTPFQYYTLAQEMGIRTRADSKFWPGTLGWKHYHSHKWYLDRSKGAPY